MRYFTPHHPALPPLSSPFTARHLRWHWPAPWLGGCAGARRRHTLRPNPFAAPAAAVPPPAAAVPAAPQRRTGMKKALFNGAMPLLRRRWLKAFAPTRCATCWPRPNGSPRHRAGPTRSPNSRAPLGVSGQRRVPLRVSQGLAKAWSSTAPAAGCGVSATACPASVVTAIWGIESNYGSNFGTFKTVDALATLAYEGGRHDWARSQLLAALRIIDRGDIAAEAMIGSWAKGHGAYAVHSHRVPGLRGDADGDGRRDIWGSIPTWRHRPRIFWCGRLGAR